MRVPATPVTHPRGSTHIPQTARAGGSNSKPEAVQIPPLGAGPPTPIVSDHVLASSRLDFSPPFGTRIVLGRRERVESSHSPFGKSCSVSANDGPSHRTVRGTLGRPKVRPRCRYDVDFVFYQLTG